MTEVQLCKFIHGNKIEINWYSEEVFKLSLYGTEVDKFVELTGRKDANIAGLGYMLTSDGTVVLNLMTICKAYGIDPRNVLVGDNSESA